MYMFVSVSAYLLVSAFLFLSVFAFVSLSAFAFVSLSMSMKIQRLILKQMSTGKPPKTPLSSQGGQSGPPLQADTSKRKGPIRIQANQPWTDSFPAFLAVNWFCGFVAAI